jgi:hypothetical protein
VKTLGSEYHTLFQGVNVILLGFFNFIRFGNLSAHEMFTNIWQVFVSIVKIVSKDSHNLLKALSNYHPYLLHLLTDLAEFLYKRSARNAGERL